jgi:5-formaminoimidazole-4-carboxamide-1-beta-D-ribofuranosyl 5'-monophosphate synthetase
VNLLAFIPHGPDRTITAAHLSALTELDDRAVRQEIERLVVEDKQPIGSGPKGYFLAQQPADLKHTIENLESRANAMHARCKALRIAQAHLDKHRPTLFDLAEV